MFGLDTGSVIAIAVAAVVLLGTYPPVYKLPALAKRLWSGGDSAPQAAGAVEIIGHFNALSAAILQADGPDSDAARAMGEVIAPTVGRLAISAELHTQ